MTRVSCYTNAPRSPLPRRAACFTSHRAARERFLLRRKRGGDFSDGGRLLINPKTPPPIEKGACQRRLWRFFFPPSPKSRKSSSFDFFSKDKNNVLTKMTTTTTTPKSFFSHFFHSLLFSNTPRNFIFFAPWGLLSDSFVSLSLSLSLSLSRFVLASPLHSLVQNSFCALLKRRRPQRKSDAVRRWGGGAFRFPSLFFSLRARALPPASSSFH